MKKDIHPDYHPVVFQDVAADWAFLTRSTLQSDRKIRWKDGKEYPLIGLEISSASHPFFTGQQRLVDSAGRVERFRTRYKGTKRGKGQVGPAAEDAKKVEDTEK